MGTGLPRRGPSPGLPKGGSGIPQKEPMGTPKGAQLRAISKGAQGYLKRAYGYPKGSQGYSKGSLVDYPIMGLRATSIGEPRAIPSGAQGYPLDRNYFLIFPTPNPLLAPSAPAPVAPQPSAPAPLAPTAPVSQETEGGGYGDEAEAPEPAAPAPGGGGGYGEAPKPAAAPIAKVPNSGGASDGYGDNAAESSAVDSVPSGGEGGPNGIVMALLS